MSPPPAGPQPILFRVKELQFNKTKPATAAKTDVALQTAAAGARPPPVTFVRSGGCPPLALSRDHAP